MGVVRSKDNYNINDFQFCLYAIKRQNELNGLRLIFNNCNYL